MFTFISFWRTAAIVLCDLASTAYYIGGIVESQIGKAAPWFILAVMLFSYAVRSVYIESCAMFVRGGVYRIVKEAMGGTWPGWRSRPCCSTTSSPGRSAASRPASTSSACSTTCSPGPTASRWPIRTGFGGDRHRRDGLYFWRVNTKGYPRVERPGAQDHGGDDGHGRHHDRLVPGDDRGAPRDEASTLIRTCPRRSTLSVKPIPDPFGKQVDPLGLHRRDGAGRSPCGPSSTVHWLSLIGVIGIIVSFGHSILAMSGEETLAQVYREVESPKLKNFKRAAFVVFLYSLLLHVADQLLRGDDHPGRRADVAKYSGNLIGGLAMNVVGPHWARLILNILVVVVGFLILSGAVNTAIVGSNGVLNRVSEDGVLPGLVPQAAPAVRHDLAADQPGRASSRSSPSSPAAATC